jgi:hypothetical protein
MVNCFTVFDTTNQPVQKHTSEKQLANMALALVSNWKYSKQDGIRILAPPNGNIL